MNGMLRSGLDDVNNVSCSNLKCPSCNADIPLQVAMILKNRGEALICNSCGQFLVWDIQSEKVERISKGEELRKWLKSE